MAVVGVVANALGEALGRVSGVALAVCVVCVVGSATHCTDKAGGVVGLGAAVPCTSPQARARCAKVTKATMAQVGG